MYTAFKCSVKVKKEYREDIYNVLNVYDWKDCNSKVFKDFSKLDRCDFIPYGSCEWLPNCWFEGLDYGFDENTGYWSFSCALKNYEKTIEYFIENVLTEIAEEAYTIETLYECDDASQKYVLSNGVLELSRGREYKRI